jgi:ABC-type branched-subunit amino acid transport system ATPase component
LERLPTHKRLQRGIARTFQNIRLFGQLSVWQNLWVAQNAPEDRARRGFFARWLGGQSGVRAEIAQLLEFSGLAHKQDELAANLAFGEQRRLELARALAAKPKLLLLDEPAAGMNSEEIGQLRERIVKLRAEGMTILLIEHVMELVMGVTDRIAVLNFGQKIAEGTPAEIQANPLVRKAYLGGA